MEVAEENRIVLVLESVAKREGVQANFHRHFIFIFIAHNHLLVPIVIRSTLSVHCLVIVLVVAHIMTTSLPLMRTVLSVLLHRVDKRLHSNRVRAFIFLQIVDVEAYSVAFTDVPD